MLRADAGIEGGYRIPKDDGKMSSALRVKLIYAIAKSEEGNIWKFYDSLSNLWIRNVA